MSNRKLSKPKKKTEKAKLTIQTDYVQAQDGNLLIQFTVLLDCEPSYNFAVTHDNVKIWDKEMEKFKERHPEAFNRPKKKWWKFL